MEDKKKAKMEEKAAKKRAKMQAKIDKVASKVTLFRQTLNKYQKAFEADGDIDSKEQKKLARLQKKIDKVEGKITSMRAKMGSSSDASVDDFATSDAERVKKVKELEEIKIELEKMLAFFELA